MKKEFFGFYEPTQTEIDKSWENGIFVFDTNTLLNLYRYSESTRKDFLLAVTKLKDKLFMPYQVGYEYHSNRHFVIDTLNNSYNSLISSIKDNSEKNITNLLNQYLRHPSIQIDSIKKLQDDFLKKVGNELEKQKKNHPDFKDKDEILIQLTELYENKVGVQFTKEELKKIYTDGKERYEQQIPPGYKDLETKRKKGEQHIYGDLIIWKEIISLSKKEKKEIIFITDDRKEDWWTIENGKTIRPREELIKEFYDLTGLRILIYNADNFLHFAKERKLVTKIKEATINEVKEVRQSDENFNTAIDLLKNTEAIKASTQWNNPVTSSITEWLKNAEAIKTPTAWNNSATSSIAEWLKNTEAIKASTQWYNPSTSSIAEWLKNTEAINASTQWINPATLSITELLKNTEAINASTQWINPVTSNRDLLKDSKTLKESTQENSKINPKVKGELDGESSDNEQQDMLPEDKKSDDESIDN